MERDLGGHDGIVIAARSAYRKGIEILSDEEWTLVRVNVTGIFRICPGFWPLIAPIGRRKLGGTLLRPWPLNRCKGMRTMH